MSTRIKENATFAFVITEKFSLWKEFFTLGFVYSQNHGQSEKFFEASVRICGKFG